MPDDADDDVVPSDPPADTRSDDGPAEPATDTKAAEAPQRTKPDRFWRELPILVLISLAIAILIKTFLIQAFYIPSISMEPTLERGDRILVCRICVHVSDIQRGDIIVFSNPHPGPPVDRGPVESLLHWLGQGLGVAQPENKDYVKRVIGLPGDVVELNDGQLYVNGEAVDEPYLDSEVDTRPFGPATVPDGMLFVLGDNRAHSGDSRFAPPTGLGYVPENTVIGKAFVIVYPPSRWGWL
ncbi:MAG TPA: signal peptidase I [Actinomycetota bacterium]|jgi:signal peptidase I|nr:signal peptidase I [Actinomycetota bacterium]